MRRENGSLRLAAARTYRARLRRHVAICYFGAFGKARSEGADALPMPYLGFGNYRCGRDRRTVRPISVGEATVEAAASTVVAALHRPSESNRIVKALGMEYDLFIVNGIVCTASDIG